MGVLGTERGWPGYGIIRDMKNILTTLPLFALAGCLIAHPPEAAEWTVESAAVPAAAAKPKYGTVRISYVAVRSPYDGRRFVVARPDGSLAFDSFNAFAASPSQLLKGPVLDALAASGRFKAVVGPSSSTVVDGIVEVTVNRLRLDCREKDRRFAEVSVSLTVLDASREIVGRATGVGVADAADGKYTAAFSSAFDAAMAEALAAL